MWDEYTKRNYFIPKEGSTEREINYIDVSSDFYHNYKEDIKLMKEMGLKMFRFSISWSRIFPKNEFETNPKGIEFYHNVLDELIKNDIEPLVTLYHWDTPIWAQCRNGFLNRDSITWFENFAKVCFEEYGKKAKYFLTFNEMIIQNLQQYVWGKLTPNYSSRSDYATQAMHYSHVACARAVKVFKELREQGIVNKDSVCGITHTEGPLYYALNENSSNDLKALKHSNLISNKAYFDVSFKGEYPQELFDLWKEVGYQIDVTQEDLDLLKENTHEFIGWNYYQPHFVTPNANFGNNDDIFSWVDETVPSDAHTTKWNWIIDPKRMALGLKQLSDSYPGLEILITENGFGDFDQEIDGKIQDQERIEYIKHHLDGCYHAINELGINLIGYCYWSFQDIFSPSAGYRKRYGFVKVDFETLKRENKLSYYYYKNVIADKNNETEYDLENLKKDLYGDK